MNRRLLSRIEKLEGHKEEEGFHVIEAQNGEEESALKKYRAEHPDAKGLFIIIRKFESERGCEQSIRETKEV